MGGKALGFETERIPSIIYNDIKSILLKFHDVGVETIFFPKAYLRKSNHGDLDVIVTEKNCDKIFKWISDNEWKLVSNGNVHSFHFLERYQVDLIICKDVMAAKRQFFYMTNGDCGNLIGKLFRHYGFRFGHNGLHWLIRKGDILDVDDVTVSRQILEEFLVLDTAFVDNQKSLIERLGLDYQKMKDGFDDLEDLSNWISKSPFFSNDFFTDDRSNMTHADRVRMRKRDSYVFVREIQQSSEKTKADMESLFLKEFDVVSLRKKCLDEYNERLKLSNHKKEVFDSRFCQETWGVTGKELGIQINEFLSQNDIYSLTKDQVHTRILSFKG